MKFKPLKHLESGALTNIWLTKLILDDRNSEALEMARGDHKDVPRASLDAALYLLYEEYQRSPSVRQNFHIHLNYGDLKCYLTFSTAYQIVEFDQDILSHDRGSEDCECTLILTLLQGLMLDKEIFIAFFERMKTLSASLLKDGN